MITTISDVKRNQYYSSVENAIQSDNVLKADELLEKYVYEDFAVAICKKDGEIFKVYMKEEKKGWRIIHDVYKQDSMRFLTYYNVVSSRFDDTYVIIVSNFNSDISNKATVSDTQNNVFYHYQYSVMGVNMDDWIYIGKELPEGYKLFVENTEIGFEDYKIDYVK